MGELLYLTEDTPIITVTSGNALRRAVYLPPHAIIEGGNVFVMRIGPELTADVVILATNYQVSSDGVWGTGSRNWAAAGGRPWGVA